MSQTQKYLQNNLNQDRPKSQNGGSTNLSEGSNQVDQEFKVQKGQKYEFINENLENWPQWSVEEKNKQAAIQKLQAVKKTNDEQLQKVIEYEKDLSFMYNRGMSLPIRIKLMQTQEQLKKAEKKSFVSNVVGKIKGWFK